MDIPYPKEFNDRQQANLQAIVYREPIQRFYFPFNASKGYVTRQLIGIPANSIVFVQNDEIKITEVFNSITPILEVFTVTDQFSGANETVNLFEVRLDTVGSKPVTKGGVAFYNAILTKPVILQYLIRDKAASAAFTRGSGWCILNVINVSKLRMIGD